MNRSCYRKWRYIYPMGGKLYLPNTPHVYCIYIDGNLVYIGSTGNLHGRFYRYAVQADERLGRCACCIRGKVVRGSEIYLKIKPFKKFGLWLMAEARLIRRLRPKFNMRHCNRKLVRRRKEKSILPDMVIRA